QGAANLLEETQAGGDAETASRLEVSQQRVAFDVFHDEEAAALVFGQQAHVVDRHEVLLALTEAAGQQLRQDRRARGVERGIVLGQAGLARDLDGDWPHETPAEGLMSLEDRTESAARVDLDQVVLAGKDLIEQTVFRRCSVHGLVPAGVAGLTSTIQRG